MSIKITISLSLVKMVPTKSSPKVSANQAISENKLNLYKKKAKSEASKRKRVEEDRDEQKELVEQLEDKIDQFVNSCNCNAVKMLAFSDDDSN